LKEFYSPFKGVDAVLHVNDLGFISNLRAPVLLLLELTAYENLDLLL
jgi:hypothetical protein